MIILEGPDGMGKSTLAADLSSRLRMRKLEIGKSPGSAAGVYECMQKCKDRALRPYIQDRVTQISEYIYGNKIFRRQYLTDQQFLDAISILVRYTDPIIVYCRVEDLDKANPVAEAYDDPQYEREVRQRLSDIRHHYDELMYKLPVDHRATVIHYDFTQQTVKDLIDEHLSESIRRRCETW